MRVAVGADHAGYLLKERLVQAMREWGHEVCDLGTYNHEPADYPDSSEAVGRAVQRGEAERGVIVCGSGVGASIAANKLRGVRAALAHDTYSAQQGVEHDDANVLCLGARVIGEALARQVLRAFLEASFSSEERHRRRLSKLQALDGDRA